jgi:hypothetical protein
MTQRARSVSPWRRRWVGVVFATALLSIELLAIRASHANLSHGSPDGAKKYYRLLAATLGFSTRTEIFKTTLDDVATYLGYDGITGRDLQNLPPDTLMNPEELLRDNVLQQKQRLVAALGTITLLRDDVLVTRFFAPKIMNIKEAEATRQLGWRKLVRMKSRPGSAARSHQIESAIILFNIFTAPGASPFSAAEESVNTQVMLVTDPDHVPAAGRGDPRATVYWLDYGPLSRGGTLSLALDATFDSNELPNPTRPYFVPDGCVACHGNNQQRSMVNYLDTDHWFDRLSNDFTILRDQGLPLLFDAKTNDPNSPGYAAAFDVIRRFNHEADEQARRAQPKHDEVLAATRWLELHASTTQTAPPTQRAIGPSPQWSAADPTEVQQLAAFNQYCFRCHGTVKFSVFNRSALIERLVQLRTRIKADAPVGYRMPLDRSLPDDVRALLRNFGRGGH